MSIFGKEENIEKAHEQANEENITRDVKEAEYKTYIAEKRKVKIAQAEQRAIVKARQPSGFGGFMQSISANMPTQTGKSKGRKGSGLAGFMNYSANISKNYGNMFGSQKKGNTMPDVMGLNKRKKGKSKPFRMF